MMAVPEAKLAPTPSIKDTVDKFFCYRILWKFSYALPYVTASTSFMADYTLATFSAPDLSLLWLTDTSSESVSINQTTKCAPHDMFSEKLKTVIMFP